VHDAVHVGVCERLDQACEHLVAADRVLTTREPDPAVLHAAVDGAIRLANALADLVTIVMRQAPAGLDPSAGPGDGANIAPVLDALLADLRARHGCLTTGPLLAPARDDLHRLITHPATTAATHRTTTQKGGPAMLGHQPNDTFDGALDDVIDDVLDDAAPVGDVAEQQRPAHPAPADDDHDEVLEQILDGVGDVLDADPADVADQRRDAPVLDETEPWP
jgi:hypothetical protein